MKLMSLGTLARCAMVILGAAGCATDSLPSEAERLDLSDQCHSVVSPFDLGLVDLHPGGDGGASTCDTEIAALRRELHSPGTFCSVIVRIDFERTAILGYQVVCGPCASTSEAAARATAQAHLQEGANGELISSPSRDGLYVFAESPSDFGGLAVVSAWTGMPLFGGGTVWSGAGDITFPMSWRKPAGLGSNCPAIGGLGRTSGYIGALPAGDLQDTLAMAMTTAAPAALWDGGSVLTTVVLLYSRTAGGGWSPLGTEWIVIINGQ